MVILETKELTYQYGVGTSPEQVMVDNADVSIHRDEFLGMIGHTSLGKSTLIQQLNGLMRPTSGQMLLSGNDIWVEPKKIRVVRFQIGLVFQYPKYQLFEETVFRDTCFGSRNMGFSGEEIKERALDTAEFVGLKTGLLEESPFELSSGEKRRAVIAGVVTMDSEVLTLDEPAAGLDPQGRDQLLDQVRSYHQQRSNTVFLVSHSMEDTAYVADRALVVDRGKVAVLGTVQQVFSCRSELENMGLRVPQIIKIMSLLRARGHPVNEGVLTMDEALRDLLPLLRERRCVR